MIWNDPSSWLEGMNVGWGTYALIVSAGVFTGVINTLAGSGSLITLPIFILLCGLPPTVANGTNRVGVILQSVVGVYGYHRAGKLALRHVEWLAIPAILGALLGAQIAVNLDEDLMNMSIGILMVVMLAVLLVNPSRWIRPSEVDSTRHKHPLSLLLLFGIGIYGGFLQAGVGIFLLAGLVLSAKYSLTAANGIKLLLVMLFTLPALISFLWAGQVHIGFGLLMAAAQAVGAVLGVRIVARIPNANVWIHRLLILIVLASGIKFLSMAFWG